MNITLISLDNWGFNQYISNALQQKGYNVTHIDFHKYKYKYPSFFHKIYNSVLKLFLKRNLKMEFYGRSIIEKLKENNEFQDLIITIKGDHIDSKSITDFKKYTKKSVGFFNDSVKRCPKISRVIPYFDEVFSFEKEDCEKYNLKFLTNFIYDKISNDTLSKKYKYRIFNISSKDKRTKSIIKIADTLKKNNIQTKIVILDSKNTLKKTNNIEIIRKPISLEKVNENIDNSEVLLDIQREKQKGLTFRVFESLGKNKKLITTNPDIVNYDFYNSNNILAINIENPEIPKAFFDNSYEPIPQNILQKYTLESWINQIIKA